MNATEDQIHASIVAYLRRALPDAVINHSRNEGNRKGMAGLLDGVRGKRMGVCAGYPDLSLHFGGVTAFVEVKGAKGKLSNVQRELRVILEGQGFAYVLARSIDDVKPLVRILRFAGSLNDAV